MYSFFSMSIVNTSRKSSISHKSSEIIVKRCWIDSISLFQKYYMAGIVYLCFIKDSNVVSKRSKRFELRLTTSLTTSKICPYSIWSFQIVYPSKMFWKHLVWSRNISFADKASEKHFDNFRNMLFHNSPKELLFRKTRRTSIKAGDCCLADTLCSSR